MAEEKSASNSRRRCAMARRAAETSRRDKAGSGINSKASVRPFDTL